MKYNILGKTLKVIVSFGLLFGLGMGLARNSALVQTKASGDVIEDSADVYRAANITQNETNYHDDVTAQPGEAIQFMVMVHLGEAETSADNVIVKVNLNESKTQRADGKFELVSKSSIDSSENDVTDTTTVIVPSDQELVFIPEHGVIVTSHGTVPSNVNGTPYNWPNPEDLFGNGINLGEIESVSTIYVSFKAYVSNKTANMSITKEVASVTHPDGNWHGEIATERGDTVRFQIVVKNTGGSELNDVLITDQLPDELEYVAGSSEYSTPFSAGFKALADSWITGQGGVQQANLGKLPVGEGYNHIIVFDAKVKDDAAAGTYKNTAQAKANEYPEWIYDQARVKISVEEGKEKLTIEKFVRWSNKVDWYGGIEKYQHMFGAGDNVYYRIIVKNTGDGDAEKVTVVDSQPEYIKWVSGDGQWDNEIDRKVTFDLGTLKAGDETELLYMSEVSGEVPTEDTKQENTAVLYRDRDRIDDNSSFIWIHGPEAPEVLAGVTELPVSGGDAAGLILVSLGMIISGWGMRRLVLSF